MKTAQNRVIVDSLLNLGNLPGSITCNTTAHHHAIDVVLNVEADDSALQFSSHRHHSACTVSSSDDGQTVAEPRQSTTNASLTS